VRVPGHGYRDVECRRGGPGRRTAPPARPGRSRRGVHLDPVPAGRSARTGRHRAAGPPCRAGGRDRALPALGGGRPRHPGTLPRRRGGARGRARRGACRPRRPARAPVRARPRGGRAHGTDQPPARRAGARGHHRDRAALLGLRSRSGGVPGHGDLPSGHRPPAPRGRPSCRGALRRHGRERVGGGGALPSGTARQALGYREILCHLEQGVPLDDCLVEAVQRTRQFARRQASWFRRDPRITWAGSGHEAQSLVADVLDVHG
jgi:hypothetical protein